MMLQGYSCDNHLYFEHDLLICARGVHQGDPLASLAISLANHLKIASINNEFNGCYQDDGTLRGNKDRVSEDLQVLQRNVSRW